MASRHAGFRGIGTENIRFALRAMFSQKLRSFLTLLGIVAGVATVIAMVSFVSGFNAAVTDSFSAFGTTLVQFQKYEPRFGGGGGPLPEDQKRRRNLTIDQSVIYILSVMTAVFLVRAYKGRLTWHRDSDAAFVRVDWSRE